MTVSAASAPQWMYSSWSRSCRALGATAGDDEIYAVARTLLTRWDEPQRKYHTISHLLEVLRRVDELAWEAHNADEVRLAAWYHGAIFSCDSASAYANRAGEDKAASAELARTDLTSLGLATTSVERVANLVNSMRRHAGQAGDSDLNVLIDADLAILAESPQVYQAYRDAIRAEYAHIPEDDYLTARVSILEKLQHRSRIFFSAGAQAWESQARENLNAELARLQRKLRASG
ncbi:hypothetical protein GCM10010401_05340 [Rarobacter faecitabidus]|uniref:Putative metal-dependent HD superfamily phosphohydrolase n=1 Tax=Rarobacter faecitabidus TaxID=13243 RepID=A0A542ZTM6_RARFA|nr:hypothetical protein [Rarobacter faecitabidus]TQL63715.1 putative metal-dependent HD superfamily phosphohydrolase [Rarobacter faecitabidus]